MCTIIGPLTFAALAATAAYFAGRYYGGKAGYARALKETRGRIRKGWAKKNTSY